MRNFLDSLSQPSTIGPRPIENVSFRSRFPLGGVIETLLEMIWETHLDECALIKVKKMGKKTYCTLDIRQ
jgi:hypothetical protein